jgi:hypothetical protein
MLASSDGAPGMAHPIMVVLVALVIAVCCGVFSGYALRFAPFWSLWSRVTDQVVAISAERQPERDEARILLAEIEPGGDDAAAARSGVTSRAHLAALLEKLAPVAPRVVLIDVDLSKPGPDPAAELRLAAAVERLTGVGSTLLLVADRAPDAGAGGPVARAVERAPRALWASAALVLGPDGLGRGVCFALGAQPFAPDNPCRLGAGAPPLPGVHIAAAVALDGSRDSAGVRLEFLSDALARVDGRNALALTMRGERRRWDTSAQSMRVLFRKPTSALKMPARDLLLDGDLSFLEPYVVILSGSAMAGMNVHVTPVGALTGAEIIVNAVEQQITYGPIEPPAVEHSVALAVLAAFFAMAVRSAPWVVALSIQSAPAVLARVPGRLRSVLRRLGASILLRDFAFVFVTTMAIQFAGQELLLSGLLAPFVIANYAVTTFLWEVDRWRSA